MADPSMTRREFLRLSAALTSAAFLSACQAQLTSTSVPTVAPSPISPTLAPTATIAPTATQRPPLGLTLLGENYPRAYFFRAAENFALQTRIDYATWEKNFNRLMGVEGKVFEEELPRLAARTLEFFTRFKKDHPDQLVLVHYNGRSRDPLFDAHALRFFAGHWAYFNGARILADVPAEAGETTLRVSDATLFRVNMGRYGNSNEDIGLCELDAQGKPNWNVSEQVQLVAVDPRANTLRVKRGAFGTAPRAFAANRAYAAAHVTEGPWGTQSRLIWSYNYATLSPRDANGKSCADILLDDLAGKFAPGGILQTFDGIQFDVLNDTLRNAGLRRAPDLNADGAMDAGMIDGVNSYGAGVVEFCRRLKEKMPGKLVLADGWDDVNQRAFGILNGIEAEGWPTLTDVHVNDWSGGLNRQSFWIANSAAPKFSYINHKFELPGGGDFNANAQYPFGIHRLVFAGAMFTDSAICFSLLPPLETGEVVSVWDELWLGTEKKLGWLGKPVGAPVHIAEREKNLFEGADILSRWQGDGIEFTRDGGAIKIAGKNPGDLRFKLTGIAASAPDLLFTFNIRADPLPGYAPEIARFIQFGTGTQASDLSYAWVNQKPFTYRHYATDWRGTELAFVTESNAPIWINDLRAFASPDGMYREFENGLVLANPSARPFTFDLRALFPNKAWRRIKGTAKQDPATNNGAAVDGSLTLPAKDAIFLVRA